MSAIDTPRRMIRAGVADHLTEVELLQILMDISSDQAQQISSTHTKYWQPSAGNQAQLRYAVGLTERQTDVFAAAMEITRRVKFPDTHALHGRAIRGIDQIADIAADLADQPQELLQAFLLDYELHIVNRVTVYTGTCLATGVRVAEILRHCIIANTPNLVIVHNHPSGKPNPSPDDLATTKDIKQAADLMNIKLLDHIVIGRSEHVSIREHQPDIWVHNTDTSFC